MEGLRADLAAAGLDLGRAVVLRRETPHGLVLVAGEGDDVHRTGQQGADLGPAELPAVLIDLGGDDLYVDSPGATVNAAGRPALGCVVTVDLAGDDAYESTHDGSQGTGLLGVGLLVDHAGDDGYVGLRWAQGTGFLGVGALVDAAGNDTYRARALAQGTGLWGLGLLVDLAGEDRYEAQRYGQAVGLAGGLGVLVDHRGEDEYYCKGTWPSGYGTAGVYEGWGQGCGVGFRTLASGGVGLLVDGGGADRYEGGNFSQGGGYYHGLGALFDRGKRDDRYVGSRYNQGFSAHQAAGYFHDEGGDDRYRARNAVISGLAWDECVSVFIDDSGDDRYEGAGFSLGASAHNAIAIFWDRRGTDTYRTNDLARSGPNDYHGGTSLSFFLDEGRDQDAYPDPALNGTERVAPEHGLFVDR